jgi:hypothetical protein
LNKVNDKQQVRRCNETPPTRRIWTRPTRIRYISVTIVLMVMLMLVLARVLIFRTVVMLMLETMLRDPENV